MRLEPISGSTPEFPKYQFGVILLYYTGKKTRASFLFCTTFTGLSVKSNTNMKLLKNLDSLGRGELAPVECEFCKNTFFVTKSLARRGLKGTKQVKCCSKKCSYANVIVLPAHSCENCNEKFTPNSKVQRFCSTKCANQLNGNNNVHLLDSWKKSVSKASKSTTRTYRKPGPKTKPKLRYEESPKKCRVCDVSIPWPQRRRATCGEECLTKCMVSAALLRTSIAGNRNRYAVGWYESPLAGRVYLESSYELAVAKDLDNSGINWRRPSFLPWTDKDGVSRRYYPDFYLPNYDVYLDPKNPFITIRDTPKINAVISQNNVKLLLLTKAELSWECILDKITQNNWPNLEPPQT